MSRPSKNEILVYRLPAGGHVGYALLASAVFVIPVLIALTVKHPIPPSAWVVAVGVLLIASVTLYVILSNIVQELQIDPINRTYTYRFLRFSAPFEGTFEDLERLTVDWRPGLRESGSYHVFLHWKAARNLEVVLPNHEDSKMVYKEARRLASILGLDPPPSQTVDSHTHEASEPSLNGQS